MRGRLWFSLRNSGPTNPVVFIIWFAFPCLNGLRQIFFAQNLSLCRFPPGFPAADTRLVCGTVLRLGLVLGGFREVSLWFQTGLGHMCPYTGL